IAIPRSDPSAVRAKGDAENQARIALHRAPSGPDGCVPELQAMIPVHRGDPPAIGAEGDGMAGNVPIPARPGGKVAVYRHPVLTAQVPSLVRLPAAQVRRASLEKPFGQGAPVTLPLAQRPVDVADVELPPEVFGALFGTLGMGLRLAGFGIRPVLFPDGL